MRFLRKMMNAWKALTPVDKVKVVTGLITHIGTAYISMDLTEKAVKEEPIPVQVCAQVSAIGLGIAAANVATGELWEGIDAINEKIQARKKEQKTEKQEEAANE